jgi:hypothetical protein
VVHENPQASGPKELNHDIDALADVAWLAQPDNQAAMRSFGFLNHFSHLPNSINPVLQEIDRHSNQDLRLDIIAVATDSISAKLSLRIHRNAAQ